MRKSTKVLSSSAIALSLLLGTGALSHAADAKTSTIKSVDVNKPYFYYNGYFAPNSKLLLDNNFINAVNNDNISINGFSVYKKRMANDLIPAITTVNDVKIHKLNNKVTGIELTPKSNTISKKAFVKAYSDFKNIGKDPAVNGVSKYTYETKADTYIAVYFNKKGYVNSLTIN